MFKIDLFKWMKERTSLPMAAPVLVPKTPCTECRFRHTETVLPSCGEHIDGYGSFVSVYKIRKEDEECPAFSQRHNKKTDKYDEMKEMRDSASKLSKQFMAGLISIEDWEEQDTQALNDLIERNKDFHHGDNRISKESFKPIFLNKGHGPKHSRCPQMGTLSLRENGGEIKPAKIVIDADGTKTAEAVENNEDWFNGENPLLTEDPSPVLFRNAVTGEITTVDGDMRTDTAPDPVVTLDAMEVDGKLIIDNNGDPDLSDVKS